MTETAATDTNQAAIEAALIPAEHEFHIGDRQVLVRALVLRDYKRVAGALGVLAQRVATEHPEIDLSQPQQHLGTLLSLYGDLASRILAQLFSLEEDYIDDHLDLVTLSAIARAVMEVNQVPVIRGNLQGALELWRAHPVTLTPGKPKPAAAA
jgi:hypothetical protein